MLSVGLRRSIRLSELTLDLRLRSRDVHLARRRAGQSVARDRRGGSVSAGGRLLTRQRYPERGAAFLTIANRDGPLVTVDDPLGNRETETRPAARRASGPPEALEDVGHVVRIDAPPVILDVELGGRAGETDGDPDLAAARTVTDRVVDEDRHQLAQPRGVAFDHNRGRIDDDPDRLRLGGLDERGCGVGRDVTEIDRSVLEGDRTGVGTGAQKEIIDEGGQMVDLGADVVERLADGMDRLVA